MTPLRVSKVEALLRSGVSPDEIKRLPGREIEERGTVAAISLGLYVETPQGYLIPHR